MEITGSSNIKVINYDPATKVMEVHFSSGSKYKYEDVPEEKHKAFMEAGSKGKYFATEFRGKFKGTKM